MNSFVSWIKNNRWELLWLVLILGLASGLRFYRLGDYMTFLGDEGRDAIVIKQLLVEHNLPFIGPPTSVGNMYLGPLYYYLMAIPMAIWWLNPVAAAGMDAVFGIATVGLIYYLVRAWFGKLPAVVAALMYAISPVTIVYARSSWNPNPTPFFALLAMIGMFKAHRTGNFWWFIMTGASLAAALQMHYLALVLLPIFGILWLYELSLIWRHKLTRRHFWAGTLVAIVAFGVLMSPLLLFDLKHNWMNYRAFMAILHGQSNAVSPGGFWNRIWPIYQSKLVERYMAGNNQLLAGVMAIGLLVPLAIAGWRKYRGVTLKWSTLAMAVWLGVGLVGIANYHGEVYDHYLGFLSPVIYLLLGAVVGLGVGRYRWGLAIGLVLVLGWFNLAISPLQYPPNRQFAHTEEVAQYIIDQSQGQPFNFALISAHNYDSAYQFVLDYLGHKPGQLPFEPTQLLWVVCEDSVCEPINNSKYEIVAFGWAKVAQETEVAGVKIFKLVPNPH